MIQVTKFKCGFCDKVYSYERTALEHEAVCFHNVETKSCATCGNLNYWNLDKDKRKCSKKVNIKEKLKITAKNGLKGKKRNFRETKLVLCQLFFKIVVSPVDFWTCGE